MAESKIIINGKEFPLQYQLLLNLADRLPREKTYADIGRAIVGLNVPSLTEKIIDRELLSVDELDKIWEQGDIDLRRALADDDTFRKNLTDTQAQEIIEQNDPEILKSIAGWAEQLYPEADEAQAMRLSGKMADALLEHIRNHKDINVRTALAENSSTPLKFKANFRECVEEGFDIDSANISKMTEDDLELLRSCSRSDLKKIANDIESIKDNSLRLKVGKFLCAYPDPSVRLELAENFGTPTNILRMLLSDKEPDVVKAAENSMGEE